ncbi:MAG: CoB--CoM heterodisulfide reductase iron-sulfur subunit A family protein [Phycisphaerae bacterium]
MENVKGTTTMDAEAPAAPRVGVYICRCGGNISDVVDTDHVADICKLIPGVAVSKVHTFMCSDPGQQAIGDDIKNEKLDRVVVASCSPFLHELTFRGAVMRSKMNPYLYEHVNIREQCSWAHKHDPRGATAKAIQLISAAVGKVSRSTPLEKIRLPNHRRALVVGGGPAGMKVASDLAACGISVLLVEQAERLGGKLPTLNRLFPSGQAATELAAKLESQIKVNPQIEILLKSEVTKVSGFIGNFEVNIHGDFGPAGKTTDIQTTVGVIVMATGFKPYVPADGEFMYKKHPAVITTVDFNALLAQQKGDSKTLQFNGRAIRRIAFIHCVGSRQVDGVHTPGADGRLNTYCSRVCCMTVLNQALQVRQRFPDTRVYDLHQDIRTYGRGHEEYYTDTSRAGVVFFRYHGDEPPKVTNINGATSPLRVSVKDYLSWGEELELEVDMVVLAVGMTPGPCETLVDQLKLPRGEDRFLQEIHPKLRPVEISVNGVLLAGTAQAPMTVQEVLTAAGAAAVKARAMFRTEEVELNPYVAEVDTRLCEGTGACIAQCEYDGALKMVEARENGRTVRKAHVNPGLCVGCGACVAVCPTQAINVSGWRIDQYDAMVDGLVRDMVPAAV